MTAGDLAEQFDLSKATMSGHFAVLREAGLVDADKQRTTITYRLKMSVLEEALLEFAESFGLELTTGKARRLARQAAKRRA